MGCWRLKIYIVRHGETNGNLRGALQGWMDELLNEKGRELAIITARALSDIKFDVAISSPLSRAYETADYSKIQEKWGLSHTFRGWKKEAPQVYDR